MRVPHLAASAIVVLCGTGCPAQATFNACQQNSDCVGNRICVAEVCRLACNGNRDCEVEQHCVNGLCEPGPASDAGAGDGARPDAVGRELRSVDVITRDRAGADGWRPDQPAFDHNGRDQATFADACRPVCTGKCAGADDGCATPCPTDLCAGVCCGTTCCADGQFCSVQAQCVQLSLAFTVAVAGNFTMGSSTSELGRDIFSGYDPAGVLDETQHLVALSRSFEIAITEVTQGDFATLMAYNPASFAECGASCPVESVSWDEAAAFCNQLSQGSDLASCFDCTGSGPSVRCAFTARYASPYLCPGYRLPAEAEWEYAARAGSSSALPNGDISTVDCTPLDGNLDQLGWYLGNSGVSYSGSVAVPCGSSSVSVGTHPVATKAASGWGLHDMNGNVWEWTIECESAYASSFQTDPFGPLDCPQVDRVYRGCGVGNPAGFCRSAERANSACGGGVHCIDIGFRPVRSLD